MAQMTQMNQMTPRPQTTHTPTGVSDRQVAGILLMAAGWGWISGNFVDPFFPFFFGGLIDLLHFLPVVVLLLLTLRFLRASSNPVEAGAGASGAHTGITLVAGFSILACAVFVVLGALNPDPNALGVHTFEDLLPVLVLNAGTLLWLSTLVPRRQNASMTATGGNTDY
jgi:hypothetical protein